MGETSTNGQSRRRARTRQALLDAAAGLLAEHRPHASIDEITGRAGVGFGSFYNHFADKEELFEAAVLEVLDRYSAWLRTATEALEDPAEIFAASFRLTGRLAAEQPELLAPLLSQGTEVLLLERGLRLDAVADIEAGVAAGRFASAESDVLLMAVGGALLGLVRLLATEPTRDADAATDLIAERVLWMLGVPPDDAREVVTRPLPEAPDPLSQLL